MKTNVKSAAKMVKDEPTNGKEPRSNILPLFWDLASLEEDKRVRRVMDLVKALQGTTVNSEKGDIRSENIENDKEYALKRLVKGLSSSRKGARQGYATALVHFLAQFDDVDISTVFDLMNKSLFVKGSFKSQEERDAYFGQAFCYAACFQATCLRSQSQNITDALMSKFVQGLLHLMNKKSFIQELCAKLIVEIIEMMDVERFTKEIFPLLEANLKQGWKTCTAEDLQILLAVEKYFKDSLGKEFFKTHWQHSTVCDKKNFESMAKVLMSTTETSHPRLHTVWKDVLPYALKSTTNLKSFWDVIIEGSLMQSTHERKFLALKVVQEVLPVVKKSQIEIIFSPLFMNAIFNASTSEKTYLNSAIKSFLNSIPSQVAKNQDKDVRLAVFFQLTGRNGNFQFDSITRTKTVESLIGELNINCVVELVSWLKELYLTGNLNEEERSTEDAKENEDAMSQRRKWAINQLLAVTRNSNAKKHEEILLDVAKFLFFHAYFHVKKKKKKENLYRAPEPAVKDTVIATCKERFASVLGELSNTHPQREVEKEQFVKTITGTTKDGDFFAYHLVKFAKELLEDSKHFSLNKVLSSEEMASFESAFQTIEDIRQKTTRDSGISESRAFELIFLHTCLRLFHNGEEAADIIQELLECFKKLNEKKKKKKTQEEPHWSEVLTEILLSYLAQSSNLMRNVVNLVFSMILPHATSKALGLILEALGPKKSAEEGGLELVHESDDDDMETNDNAIDSDDEVGSDEDSNDEDDEDESSDESETEAHIDDEFRSEIKSALGDAAVNDEDVIEPLLDVVRMSAGHKEETALHDRAHNLLKNKICHARELPNGSDINQAEVHEQIGRLVLLANHAPSIDLVHLVTQACMFLIRVLRGCVDVKEPSPLQTRTQRKRKKQAESNIPVQSSNDGLLDTVRIVGIFSSALDDFMLKRNSHLQPVLFLELIKRYPTIAWKMAAKLPAYFSTAANNFRKIQSCQFILQLMARKVGCTDEDFQNLTLPLRDELISVFRTTVKENCSMKARHFHEYFKLLDKFLKEANKNGEILSQFKTDNLVEALEAAIKVPQFPDLHRPVQNGHNLKKKMKKETNEMENSEELNKSKNSKELNKPIKIKNKKVKE
eukprot:gene9944-10964_t